MSDPEADEATSNVEHAISAAVGELVTGWVLLAESITDNGEQAIWYLHSKDQPGWRTLGFLEWGKLKASGEDDD